MKLMMIAALVTVLSGCGTIVSNMPEDTPTPVKAAGYVAEAAGTWRIWELLGWVK